MAIAAHILNSDESVSVHTLESGETLTISSDQRVTLPEVASPDAMLAISAADVLSVSVAAESVSFPGLLANIENETGSDLTFADGMVIDSLGALLGRVSMPESAISDGSSGLGMADLIHDELDSGDLLYLDEAVDLGLISPPHLQETLDLAELVQAAPENDALFGALEDISEHTDPAHHSTDLWVNTEFTGAFGGVAHPPGDGVVIDPLISVDDGIA